VIGQAKRRSNEKFELYAGREGVPHPQSEAGPVYPAAGAVGGGPGDYMCDSDCQLWNSGYFTNMKGGHMAKKQVVEFDRVHSGQAAHRQQVRLLAYWKRMTGVGRHGRR
jgi:hypothetical protein